ELYSKLQASAALGAESLELDWHDIARSQDGGKGESESLRKQVDELREENELLMLQMHQLQEELESYYLELQRTKLDRVDAKEIEVLQRELKEARKDREKADRRARRLKKALKASSESIEAMQRSTSWRVTRPLRFVSRIFEGR